MTMEEQNYALGDMDRRLANILRFGTIAAVDVANALVTVDLGDLVTDWLPWIAARAGENRTWAPPDIGEQVALLSPGDPSQGLVIGSIFQDAHPANGNASKDTRVTFKDGTVIEQDRDSGVLNITASAGGAVNIVVGGSSFQINTSHIMLASNGASLELSATGVSLNGARIDLN